jgi:hypothetical protein
MFKERREAKDVWPFSTNNPTGESEVVTNQTKQSGIGAVGIDVAGL